MDQHPAIDVDDRPSDVGGEIGGKKQIRIGDIARLAEAVERDAFQYLGSHFRCELAAGNIGLDQPWGEAVDTDPIWPQLARHRLGKTQHARFRR